MSEVPYSDFFREMFDLPPKRIVDLKEAEIATQTRREAFPALQQTITEFLTGREIPFKEINIIGSVAVGMAQHDSDLDLEVVFGSEENKERGKQELKALQDQINQKKLPFRVELWSSGEKGDSLKDILEHVIVGTQAEREEK